MYYEHRYVRVDGTFKVALLAIGAVAAPFALFMLPPAELAAGDVFFWTILLAMSGALVGTVIGYTIDRLILRVKQSSRLERSGARVS